MSKDKPLISVVIPMYNAINCIEETIQSVIKQTYNNWELIIVDDCSTDNSISLVNKFKNQEKRIKVIESSSNFGGPARPRNIGIDHAEGKYIAFLDSDDIWSEKKLELQISYMLRNSLNFSDTGFIEIDEHGQTINLNNSWRYKLFHKRKKDLCRLVGSNFITLSSAIIEKRFLERFSEDIECIAVEDYALWLNLFNKTDIQYGFYHEYLLKYRIVETSISERTQEGKQDLKAMLCSLRFMMHTKAYKLLPCFYKHKAQAWLKELF